MSVDLYLQMKNDICALVTEDNQHTVVPACPEWTLRDLIGHQVGELEDAHLGNLDDLGQSHWTAAQVARYAHYDLAGVKQAWDDLISDCGESFPEIAAATLPDYSIHMFDVRGAVGNTDGRESELVHTGFERFTGFVDGAFRAANVPALRIITGDTNVVLGDGDAQGELETTPFEFTRFVTGRRSLAQMRAMDWSTDPTPWLDHISFMAPRETDLIE